MYSAHSIEPPLRSAIFTIEQLEVHAKTLAAAHTLSLRRGGDQLLKRLADSERIIAQCHDLMSITNTTERHLTPAAEWLLDNHYLIEEQVFLTRKHFPAGYSRQLPRLARGESKGLPRVYDLVLELISHVDGRVDDEALSRYITSYQTIAHLSLGELWSVPIMLRLGLIENLRRVAVSVSWQRAHRESALAWARRINDPKDKHESAFLVLADMVHENPPLTTPFVAQFTQALQGRGATTTFVMAWLEQRLAEQSQTIEEVIRAESQNQAADQASMANSIASLRFINATEWHKFVEAHSCTEKILRSDPSRSNLPDSDSLSTYERMDFTTRDAYRHAIERLARELRVNEEKVAETAVTLASMPHDTPIADIQTHVGYFLVDEGKLHLKRALRGRKLARFFPQSTLRGLKLFLYLGPITLLSTGLVAWFVMQSYKTTHVVWPILAVCAALAASQCAISIMNWFISMIRRPRSLPRMDFECGIPDSCRTIVVVPTLLIAPQRITELIENLELRYLANRDPNLWFALLTDFCDANQEHLEEDETLIKIASSGIEELNIKYNNGAHGRFYLLHRPRQFNPQEGCWMGHERKRGKLEDFNNLLKGEGGAQNHFSHIIGDAAQLTSIRYVITLDTDTDLPWGSAWRLAGTAAHPLNRAVLDSMGQYLIRGYAILQPRISISLNSAQKSHYSNLLAGEVGIDPYTRVVSDLYQDLFAEASFIGKGIYEVNSFRQLLDHRFPDNTVLSHDLLESCYARTGQCSDVELLESAPSHYLADVSRRHRWMRGDWQISPWLGLRVRNIAGKRIHPQMTALGWWKIFDNLRRTFVAPAFTLLLTLGWIVLPSTLTWTLAVLALLFIPELLSGLGELVKRPPKLPLRIHLTSVRKSTIRRFIKIALWLTFLPFESVVALDASFRTLWRIIINRRHLLEWQTAAAVESNTNSNILKVLQRMWVGPLLALIVEILLFTIDVSRSPLAASPVLLLWFLSPLAAWWVSRPLRSIPTHLSDHDKRSLRQAARLTWRYFEVFAGSQENWLPPDNFQMVPNYRVAHRTSPTDMSMTLLSNLAAHDLGYLSCGQLLDRTSHLLESMEQMERYHGHFFNWYDTKTRKPLRPLYISTVDSGNLVGHIRVLRMGLLEAIEGSILPEEAWSGLRDTFLLVTAHLKTVKDPSNIYDQAALKSINDLLLTEPQGMSAIASRLRSLNEMTTRLATSIDRHKYSEESWWASALDRQVRSFLDDLLGIAPWLSMLSSMMSSMPQNDQIQHILIELDQTPNLQKLRDLAVQSVDVLHTLGIKNNGNHFIESLSLGIQNISSRINQIKTLAERCMSLADAEFSFLYDPNRKLMSIGYRVDDRKMDSSYYDLLASEARLASFAAIAAGQIPFEHWFALGRRLTSTSGKQTLLSWSGSMFEYLMPLLVMPNFDGTLLDETCRAAVARQIDYGKQRGVPWGISESCYNVTDAEGTYQYRAFGVPGLGFQRGLSDDVVISPYASALALLVDPRHACGNLRRMADEGYIGPFGFYEAIDFTPSRVKKGERSTVIQTFMAHHHGMSLLGLSQSVLGLAMHRRFLSNPDFRAATLLLQERIPKGNALMHPYAREARISRQLPGQTGRTAEPTMRIFTNPNTPVPEVHLLSNGRYHVMVSAAGGGFSRWNDLAITRWREDPTSESFGTFCFIGDKQTHRYWSNSFQPTLHAGQQYEAIFTPGKAEFRRHDDQVETHTEIAVSPEDDIEIRRIKLTNRSKTIRSLVVTSYAEAVLAPGVTDELHRIFSNLFIHMEIVPDQNAILVTRRPRSSKEVPPWMFCALQSSSNHVGPCSYETDRMQCIGRGRTVRQPAMMDFEISDWGPLANTKGPALDPCLALRRSVDLPIDHSVRIDLIIGAAPTREAALALAAKYQDHRIGDRVFEVAATHSRAVLGHLGASEAEAQQYEKLASAIIFPAAAYRAPSGILRRNRKGQSGLWGYSISGDLPIVLLRVGNADNLHVVRDLLKAHAFWRMRGLLCDLVIWNEDTSGYHRLLHDKIQELITARAEPHLLDKPGKIFVQHVENFTEDDRVLLQAVARIVMRDVDGPLDQQLERWRRASQPSRPLMLTPSRITSLPSKKVEPLTARRDLIFFNGTGGFTKDGREYIIDLRVDPQVDIRTGLKTPMPWVNVIANSRLGTVVSESGSASTWYSNAQLYRLTPWSNDPVSDASGELIYIRDETSGCFFSPTPYPHTSSATYTCPYTCRHGFGYSIFEHREGELDIESELTTYVAVDAPVKFLALKIKNTSDQIRAISVFASADLVLGDHRSKQAMHVSTEIEPVTGAILARNRFNNEFSEVTVFFDCSESLRNVSGDRIEFLGRNHSSSNPAALRVRQLSGRLGPGFDPCAAMQVRVDLAAGAEREIVFILGAGENNAEAISLIQRYRGKGAARVALEEVWQYWQDKLGILYAETPDAAMNVLMNGWLPYQVLSCRMWGRSAFYQSGGAYGFRDQLQDCLALLHQVPDISRQHLLLSAKRQFSEGDVQHWWHPPGGRGVRTRCSDDYLWLPYAVCRYVEFTGDTGILDEKIPFLVGRQLNDYEESYYDLPGQSEENEKNQSNTLYEHCKLAIKRGLKFGVHNLPLMGSGDWNDGMNRVGHLGKGESVWLAFFLHDVLSRFAIIAEQHGNIEFSRRCLITAGELANQIEKNAWDGEWYRRAYFDNGEPLGSVQNDECRIDSLPQSWATIAGAGLPEHQHLALDSVWKHLVHQDLQIVQLFDPAFDKSTIDPGYIKGYPPGVRENAAQYTHAAVWVAWAFALAGQCDKAASLVTLLNPINHALNPAGVDRYKVEPYVVAADIYSQTPHAGRGGWTWYTGSAAWYYRLLHEVILGIDRQVDTLRFRPRVPASWSGFKIHYRYYQTFYHLIFVQDSAFKGPARLTLDGEVQQENLLKLFNDQNEHTVEVLFGPCE